MAGNISDCMISVRDDNDSRISEQSLKAPYWYPLRLSSVRKKCKISSFPSLKGLKEQICRGIYVIWRETTTSVQENKVNGCKKRTRIVLDEREAAGSCGVMRRCVGQDGQQADHLHRWTAGGLSGEHGNVFIALLPVLV